MKTAKEWIKELGPLDWLRDHTAYDSLESLIVRVQADAMERTGPESYPEWRARQAAAVDGDLRKQPPPKPGKQDVTAGLGERIAAIHRARREAGIREYGTPLQTQNGRDALDDLDAELADAQAYAHQARLEREEMHSEFSKLKTENDRLVMLHMRTPVGASVGAVAETGAGATVGASASDLAPKDERSIEIAELRARLERAEVQLAGCGVAALDGRAEVESAPDAWGWSPAYGDVLKLRRKYEALVGWRAKIMFTAGRVRGVASGVEVAALLNAIDNPNVAAAPPVDPLKSAELRERELVALRMHFETLVLQKAAAIKMLATWRNDIVPGWQSTQSVKHAIEAAIAILNGTHEPTMVRVVEPMPPLDRVTAPPWDGKQRVEAPPVGSTAADAEMCPLSLSHRLTTRLEHGTSEFTCGCGRVFTAPGSVMTIVVPPHPKAAPIHLCAGSGERIEEGKDGSVPSLCSVCLTIQETRNGVRVDHPARIMDRGGDANILGAAHQKTPADPC